MDDTHPDDRKEAKKVKLRATYFHIIGTDSIVEASTDLT